MNEEIHLLGFVFPRRLFLVLSSLFLFLLAVYGGGKLFVRAQEKKIATLEAEARAHEESFPANISRNQTFIVFSQLLSIKNLFEHHPRFTKFLQYFEQNTPAFMKIKAFSLELLHQQLNLQIEVETWEQFAQLMELFRAKGFFQTFEVNGGQFQEEKGVKKLTFSLKATVNTQLFQ